MSTPQRLGFILDSFFFDLRNGNGLGGGRFRFGLSGSAAVAEVEASGSVEVVGSMVDGAVSALSMQLCQCQIAELDNAGGPTKIGTHSGSFPSASALESYRCTLEIILSPLRYSLTQGDNVTTTHMQDHRSRLAFTL